MEGVVVPVDVPVPKVGKSQGLNDCVEEGTVEVGVEEGGEVVEVVGLVEETVVVGVEMGVVDMKEAQGLNEVEVDDDVVGVCVEGRVVLTLVPVDRKAAQGFNGVDDVEEVEVSLLVVSVDFGGVVVEDSVFSVVDVCVIVGVVVVVVVGVVGNDINRGNESVP